jgi:hypothetical protein
MNVWLGRIARSSLVSITLLLACSSSSSGPGGGAGPKGRGSPACNQWQTAVCAWATKCGSPIGASCQDQANSITCTSDDKAQTCANTLNNAACTSPPVGCDLRDLADPAPAVAACNQFVDEVCAWSVRCDPSTTAESCRAQLMTTVDCTKVIGFKLGFEQCMTETKALACTATTLPMVCSGVLISGS